MNRSKYHTKTIFIGKSQPKRNLLRCSFGSQDSAPRNLHLLLFFLLFSLIISGCSSINLQNQLANKGAIRLDEFDPYFVTNHYLSDLLKRDQVALDFLNSQGTPDAISVRKEFLQPAKVHLFYLAQQQAFLVEHELEDIVIRGPAALPDSILQQLQHLKPLRKEATLILGPKPKNDQREVRRDNYAPQELETSSGEPSSTTPAPTTADTEPYVHTVGPSRSPFVPSVPAVNAQLPSNQPSSSPLVHKVGQNNESMWSIAKWYTGKGINHKQIASFNNIKNPSRLRLGQKIKIPFPIIKNRKPYPNK